MKNVKEFFLEVGHLIIINFLDIRTVWPYQLVFGVFTPIGMIIFLSTYIGDDIRVKTYLLTGNIVLSMVMPIMLLLTSRLANLKQLGALEYYFTLPIKRVSLITGLVISFFFMYLPSVIITLFLGQWILNISIISSSTIILMILILILSVISVIGIATLIGISARSAEEANVFGNIVFFIFTAFSPVLILPEKIPGFLQKTGYFFPTSYSANLLRQVIKNSFDTNFMINFLALSLFAVFSLILISISLHKNKVR